MTGLPQLRYGEHTWLERFTPHWSALTESGVTGDATAATVEKGRVLLERAQCEIAEYIGELAVRERNSGTDHH